MASSLARMMLAGAASDDPGARCLRRGARLGEQRLELATDREVRTAVDGGPLCQPAAVVGYHSRWKGRHGRVVVMAKR